MSIKEQKELLIKSWKNFDKSLIDAFLKIPRENFILEGYSNQAYADYALPILRGQTISQPTTIMLMMHSLELKKGQKVLEIGSGSGYQAALLSKVVGSKGKVYSVEIIDELVKFARKNIGKLNLKNIEIIKGDGSLGLKKYAPYDRILVTAGCPSIPKVLIEQLKENGILISPVGPLSYQSMIKLKKNKKIIKENLGEFRFVPLVGEKGHKINS